MLILRILEQRIQKLLLGFLQADVFLNSIYI